MSSQIDSSVQQHHAAESTSYWREKKEAEEMVQSVPQYEESEGKQEPEEPVWKPGFVSRFPFLGIGALFVVILCSIIAIVILFVSNGKVQGDQSWKQMYKDGLARDRWPKQIRPSVILSILNNAANLAFSLAIANGVAIAWWRKALMGSTIESLHKSWQFSSSIKAAALSGTAFNVIALAALTAKLTMIDGILMQSATTTVIMPDNPDSSHTISASSNTTIPITGRWTGRSHEPNMISTSFGSDLISWDNHPALLPYTNFEGCENATCFLTIPGAGFEFDCSQPVARNVSWDKQLAPTTSNGSLVIKSANLFDVSFYSNNSYSWLTSWDGNGEQPPTPAGCDANLMPLNSVCYTPAFLTMHVLYSETENKADNSCPGMTYEQTCTLRPAIINYPVMLQRYDGSHQDSGISLLPEKVYNNDSYVPSFDYSKKQQDGFEVVRLNDVIEPAYDSVDAGTRLTGITLGLNVYLGGTTTLSYDPIPGYELSQQRQAPQYLLSTPGVDQCGFKFNNPMDPESSASRPVQSIITSINQIMFALSIDVSNTDQTNNVEALKQSYNATIYTESIHYKTNFAYMWGAVASTLFCVVCILPVYWGYWQLGRKVALSPFEIAHAFRSPMTAQAENGDIEQVMKKVGQRQVQYGHIVSGDARGVFGVAEPEYVATMATSATKELREKILKRNLTR